MHRISISLLLGLVFLLASQRAWAADAPQGKPPRGGAKAAPLMNQVWNDEDRPASATVPAPKMVRFAARVVKQYDANGDGVLQKDEWAKIPGKPAVPDGNRDGAISVDELAASLAKYAHQHPLQDDDTAWQHAAQPPAHLFDPTTPAAPGRPQPGEAGSASEHGAEDGAQPPKREQKYFVAPGTLPGGLPEWFLPRDLDGDAQLTLGEFDPQGSAAQRRIFAEYDKNKDGVLTPDEVVSRARGTASKSSAAAASSTAATETKSTKKKKATAKAGKKPAQ